MTKPFSLEELVARIRSDPAPRRARPSRSRAGSCSRTSSSTRTRARSRARGEPIELTATEYRLLRYLMLNPRRVLTRAQILDHVWDYDFGGDARVLETYISYLRKKLDAHGPPLIHTVRGVGYALRPPRADACRCARACSPALLVLAAVGPRDARRRVTYAEQRSFLLRAASTSRRAAARPRSASALARPGLAPTCHGAGRGPRRRAAGGRGGPRVEPAAGHLRPAARRRRRGRRARRASTTARTASAPPKLPAQPAGRQAVHGRRRSATPACATASSRCATPADAGIDGRRRPAHRGRPDAAPAAARRGAW